ncbi:hypothetical protein BDDG_13685, partial [Blastomyces dermatitidis ATCC 18188]
ITDSLSYSSSFFFPTSSSSLNQKKTYAQAAESAVSKPAVSKSAQNSEKTEKNTAHASIHRKSKISEVRVTETQNMHSVPEITKLVSINVKHAQKEVKFINILCLSALIAKKNMHLAQKN